jgi:hypothetical protein
MSGSSAMTAWDFDTDPIAGVITGGSQLVATIRNIVSLRSSMGGSSFIVAQLPIDRLYTGGYNEVPYNFLPFNGARRKGYILPLAASMAGSSSLTANPDAGPASKWIEGRGEVALGPRPGVVALSGESHRVYLDAQPQGAYVKQN